MRRQLRPQHRHACSRLQQVAVRCRAARGLSRSMRSEHGAATMGLAAAGLALVNVSAMQWLWPMVQLFAPAECSTN